MKKKKEKKRKEKKTFGGGLLSFRVGGDVDLVIGGNQLEMSGQDWVTIQRHLVSHHHNDHTVVKQVAMKLPSPLRPQIPDHQDLSLWVLEIRFLQ